VAFISINAAAAVYRRKSGGFCVSSDSRSAQQCRGRR